MKIVGRLQHDCSLVGQSASTTDVFLRDSCAVETIQHSKHPQELAPRTKQGNGQELLHLVFADYIQIGSGSATGLVGPENFLCPQCFGGDAFGEDNLAPARFTARDSVTHQKLITFQQSDETPAVTQELGGTGDEGLKKMFEILARAQFGGDLEQLV